MYNLANIVIYDFYIVYINVLKIPLLTNISLNPYIMGPYKSFKCILIGFILLLALKTQKKLFFKPQIGKVFTTNSKVKHYVPTESFQQIDRCSTIWSLITDNRPCLNTHAQRALQNHTKFKKSKTSFVKYSIHFLALLMILGVKWCIIHNKISVFTFQRIWD